MKAKKGGVVVKAPPFALSESAPSKILEISLIFLFRSPSV